MVLWVSGVKFPWFTWHYPFHPRSKNDSRKADDADFRLKKTAEISVICVIRVQKTKIGTRMTRIITNFYNFAFLKSFKK